MKAILAILRYSVGKFSVNVGRLISLRQLSELVFLLVEREFPLGHRRAASKLKFRLRGMKWVFRAKGIKFLKSGHFG